MQEKFYRLYKKISLTHSSLCHIYFTNKARQPIKIFNRAHTLYYTSCLSWLMVVHHCILLLPSKCLPNVYIGIAPSFNASCSKQKAFKTFLFRPIAPKKRKSNIHSPPLLIPEHRGNCAEKELKEVFHLVQLYHCTKDEYDWNSYTQLSFDLTLLVRSQNHPIFYLHVFHYVALLWTAEEGGKKPNPNQPTISNSVTTTKTACG